MKVEEVIWIIIFFGTLGLSIFIPYGFYIFILTGFPYFLGVTRRCSRMAVSITMLIVFVIFTIMAIVAKFKIDIFGTLMFFCLMSGYLLMQIECLKEKNESRNNNRKS